MSPITTLCATLLLVAAVNAGTNRFVRQSGTGWSGSAPSGWSALSPVNINMQGISAVAGEGSGVAEHDAVINVQGTADNPAQLNVYTGSGASLSQSASNYQQSNSGPEGSNAYQGTFAQNNGNSYDFLGLDASGDLIDVVSSGWSGIQGAGVAEQADALNHSAGTR